MLIESFLNAAQSFRVVLSVPEIEIIIIWVLLLDQEEYEISPFFVFVNLLAINLS